MSPDPAKVKHIKAWSAPTSKNEVKLFLQTVQFVAPFMRREKGKMHADVIAPLRQLTKNHVKFKCTKECQRAFKELKSRISDKTVLVPYVPDLQIRVYVDHGPAGIASTIAQYHAQAKHPGWKAVHHKSRSLVSSEMNYNKGEGDSLAIYSGVLMVLYRLGAAHSIQHQETGTTPSGKTPRETQDLRIYHVAPGGKTQPLRLRFKTSRPSSQKSPKGTEGGDGD